MSECERFVTFANPKIDKIWINGWEERVPKVRSNVVVGIRIQRYEMKGKAEFDQQIYFFFFVRKLFLKLFFLMRGYL